MNSNTSNTATSFKTHHFLCGISAPWNMCVFCSLCSSGTLWLKCRPTSEKMHCIYNTEDGIYCCTSTAAAAVSERDAAKSSGAWYSPDDAVAAFTCRSCRLNAASPAMFQARARVDPYWYAWFWFLFTLYSRDARIWCWRSIGRHLMKSPSTSLLSHTKFIFRRKNFMPH